MQGSSQGLQLMSIVADHNYTVLKAVMETLFCNIQFVLEYLQEITHPLHATTLLAAAEQICLSEVLVIKRRSMH